MKRIILLSATLAACASPPEPKPPPLPVGRITSYCGAPERWRPIDAVTGQPVRDECCGCGCGGGKR